MQAELDGIVAEMSHWEPDSTLGRYNRAPAGTWHALPPRFAEVLDYALDVAEASGGAYDPFAGALVNLWGFGAERRYNQADFYAPASGACASRAGRAGARCSRCSTVPVRACCNRAAPCSTFPRSPRAMRSTASPGAWSSTACATTWSRSAANCAAPA